MGEGEGAERKVLEKVGEGGTVVEGWKGGAVEEGVLG